ncbi:MAG: ATP-binding cassette domain-containing protein [Lachnospiraceae bacterium]|nr:ATP-binding cassette domain-containing protein [Lachnospiraceae bacterium]
MALLADFVKKIGNFQLNISLDAGNESLSLLGASGCGKSMTLKCIAGIEKPDKGRIELNGVTLFDSEKGINLPPQERRVGYLFQEGALFPNMTILENVICGIRGKMPRSDKVKIAREMLAKMHLSDTERRRPDELSGGQQQRAALARILVNEPEILLLDEPFSALDSHLRFELERVVNETIHELKKPAILVSHNRDEAFRITDKIAIMNNGRIEICGERHRVFANPGTVYAARLTGCKNVAAAIPLSINRISVPGWGMELEVPSFTDDITAVGIRMHDICLGPGKNEFNCKVVEEIENPFSYTIMVTPDRQGDRSCAPELKPLGVELDKPTWEAARAETVIVHIPPDKILLLHL